MFSQPELPGNKKERMRLPLSVISSDQPNFGKLPRFGENSGLPKTFWGISLFFIEYFCNRSPKMRTIKLKNYISILAILSNRNGLDASSPLKTTVTVSLNVLVLFDQKRLIA